MQPIAPVTRNRSPLTTAAPAVEPTATRSNRHVFGSRPMPSIATVTTSPSASRTGGSRKIPTPPGVPVAITSPGSSVNAREQWLMIAATPKYMSAVVARCMTSSLTRHSMASACGSGSSSAVTSAGPIGQKVSSDLPRVHWPSPNWRSRAETSLRQV